MHFTSEFLLRDIVPESFGNGDKLFTATVTSHFHDIYLGFTATVTSHLPRHLSGSPLQQFISHHCKVLVLLVVARSKG